MSDAPHRAVGYRSQHSDWVNEESSRSGSRLTDAPGRAVGSHGSRNRPVGSRGNEMSSRAVGSRAASSGARPYAGYTSHLESSATRLYEHAASEISVRTDHGILRRDDLLDFSSTLSGNAVVRSQSWSSGQTSSSIELKLMFPTSNSSDSQNSGQQVSADGEHRLQGTEEIVAGGGAQPKKAPPSHFVALTQEEDDDEESSTVCVLCQSVHKDSVRPSMKRRQFLKMKAEKLLNGPDTRDKAHRLRAFLLKQAGAYGCKIVSGRATDFIMDEMLKMDEAEADLIRMARPAGTADRASASSSVGPEPLQPGLLSRPAAGSEIFKLSL
eukprot:TRINITY_DN8179_c0_g1_i1.p1 TRINITY_DN8179_c0_g1~~TRINITY_DN8179_c0_g1_i1.p1  ORF type:complete len:326 (-),score=22.51 TRINITY_DN8179_c0_g1_i1:32-1009(-)